MTIKMNTKKIDFFKRYLIPGLEHARTLTRQQNGNIMLFTVAIFAGLLALGSSSSMAQQDNAYAGLKTHNIEHEFYFTRGIYEEFQEAEWGQRWAVDYPKADQQFLIALQRLTIIDAYNSDNALTLDDPDLRNYPFLYVLEVGALNMDEGDALALRNYLLSGGFLVIDDFWGSWAWENFEQQMNLALPEYDIVEVPEDHPVFHAFYDIDQIVQVPNVHQAKVGPSYEYDGKVPHVRGIFDEKGRLMVLINWNTDLGDAWEWADDPLYPLKYSTYAYEIGINFVVYGMSY